MPCLKTQIKGKNKMSIFSPIWPNVQQSCRQDSSVEEEEIQTIATNNKPKCNVATSHGVFYFRAQSHFLHWKHSCSPALLQYVFAITVTIATHTDNLWLDAT